MPYTLLWSPKVARTVGLIGFAKTSHDDLDGFESNQDRLKDVKKWFPDAVEIEWGKEVELSLQSPAILIPHEIPVYMWEEMLEVLPPINMKRGKDSSSFMMSEYWNSNITRIFARIGSVDNARYFEMRDVDTLTHDDIVAKCMGVINEQ